jgi:hypothetical protein
MRGGSGLAAALGIAAVAATAAVGPGTRQLPAGGTCSARPGWTAITLTDTTRPAVAAVPAAGHLVVTVPGWPWGTATDVYLARSGIVQEQCTVVLPDHGRRTVFLAVRPGSTWLGATVQPAGDAMMPAWRGEVTVQASRG